MWASFVNVVVSLASMVPFLSPLAPPATHEHISKCVNPAVRREWRTLSVAERTEWIGAIKCLAKMPHNSSVHETQFRAFQPRLNPNSSFFDDLTFVHNDLIELIHGTGLFFPWHRHHLRTLENAIRTHCGYKGVMSYWDWTQDAPDFENSLFWNDSDPESGLGGWGNPDADMQVADGAFAGFKLAYPVPHNLRRHFRLRPYLNTSRGFHIIPTRMVNESFTRAEVMRVISSYVGDYRGFQKELGALPGMHSSVHSIVGGDLAGECPSDAPEGKCHKSVGYSPNDPLFYLHHGMIDKIWYDWQNAHPANKNSFSGGSVEHMANTEDFDKYPAGGPPDLDLTSSLPSNGLHGPVTVGDVLSTTGGYLCYDYV
ncbi:hypothetical protein GALMADRAFT_259070 [Galerina marginata CBS 339.88]|uniref:Tyrosinase copper-binding domain-containing protein n=1 Tax=Galerina marginata (strain CBS 339.88) TaxID=685588 RepID=A0A067S9C3_GALM3|nr:hypothetical protein GALMADRAFT_259070 [Galerina marginata CBS 339.88]